MPRRFGSDGEVCPRKSLDKWGAGPYDGRKHSEDMPMKILIFDPVGGASGDMILGSLLHLGCPVDTLTGSGTPWASWTAPPPGRLSWTGNSSRASAPGT